MEPIEQTQGEPPLRAEDLGSPEFRRDHGVRLAYVAGAMYKGIASRELVAAMGSAGLLSFLGTGGLALDEIESAIRYLQERLPAAAPYGSNLLSNPADPELEEATVELLLRLGVHQIEASAYTEPSPAVVRFRLSGARRGLDGMPEVPNRVMAKISDPRVARHFLSPPAPQIVAGLLERGVIEAAEAQLAPHITMADDLCVEADSGGHTTQASAYSITPAIVLLRDELIGRTAGSPAIRVGAGGGLGTPHAIAAAFVLGADFVVTGSVNQCTVEAGTSDRAKDMLEAAGPHDMAVVPSGDLFEIGAKMQVLKRGLLFPARASRLHELYRQFDAWDSIDEPTRRRIEMQYFKRSFAEVVDELAAYHRARSPEKWAQIKAQPKRLMAMVFRWYFYQANHWALSGDPDRTSDFQIQCGPAMGSFNQWVKGTSLTSWRNRHVDRMGQRLMTEAARILDVRYHAMRRGGAPAVAIPGISHD
jgi:trans-AT polyketide synthase/acyltransferase/oxidoreductase domain-containing protein